MTTTTTERFVWAFDYIAAANLLTRGYSYFTVDFAHQDNLNCRQDGHTLFRFVIDEVPA